MSDQWSCPVCGRSDGHDTDCAFGLPTREGLEIERLQAENERLRAALEEIYGRTINSPQDIELFDIAADALATSTRDQSDSGKQA